MNTKSLNRSIGLAMSALQQARANNSNMNVLSSLAYAIKMLNRARVQLKKGLAGVARYYATSAQSAITFAIRAR